MKKLALLLLLPISILAQNIASVINHNEGEVILNKKSISKSPVQFVLIDAGINSELSEIGSNGFLNKFLIVTNKKRRHTETTVNQYGNYNNNVYCTDVKKDGMLSFPILFANKLDSKFDDGNLSFSEKTNVAVYSQQFSDTNDNYKLFSARLEVDCKENWTNQKEVKICDEKYSVLTPIINKEGNKIYFSSNMPGGYGGYDLYSADINFEAEISNIKNLGVEVNSSKDEKYPCLDPVNKYIYYSSNGFFKNNGFDIYRVSELKDNTYYNRVNLGDKVNTKQDELAFVLTSPNTGYISVNKANDVENFDIFRFSFIQSSVKSKIFIKEKTNNVLLPNALVTVKDEFGNIVFDGKSDEYGCIDIVLMPYGKYDIVTLKDGYLRHNGDLEVSDEKLINNVVYLDAKPIEIVENKLVVENIYFDYNKATLKKESTITMNKIAALLEQYPDIKLNIFAHTDTKGSDQYNDKLSEKRAQTTYQFLIKKGIAKERLTYKGMGETQPMITCAKCTKDEDSKNRRTEFIVAK